MSEKIKPVPYKHAAVIKAWADGLTVQLERTDGTWVDLDSGSARGNMPAFYEHFEYRIKPEPTDFERYGVEVGDVWLTTSGTWFISSLVGSETFRVLEGGLITKRNLKTLRFRRGEVNKL